MLKASVRILTLLALLPLPSAATRAGAAGGEADVRLPGSRVSLRTIGARSDDPDPPDAEKDRTPLFRTAYDAVAAFLAAVKAEDAVRLREASSPRAPTEADPKNRLLFRAILEQTLSEDELTELASQLEGFQIAGAIPRQTGIVIIDVVKPGPDGAQFVRPITVRYQQGIGWRVRDIGEPRERKRRAPRVRGQGSVARTGANSGALAVSA